MKRKSSVRKEKKGDILIRRKGVLYRRNKLDPRRNLRQG